MNGRKESSKSDGKKFHHVKRSFHLQDPTLLREDYAQIKHTFYNLREIKTTLHTGM